MERIELHRRAATPGLGATPTLNGLGTPVRRSPSALRHPADREWTFPVSAPGGLAVSNSGQRDFEGGSAPERTVGVGEALPATPARVDTVYDDIRELLTGQGWIQGRETSGTRLSLTAAIDCVIGVDADMTSGVAVGPRLARIGRVRRHLCELAGAANLVSWNDDGARSVNDVDDLLTFAAVAYPND